MVTTLVVALAVIVPAWVVLTLPLAIACGRAFDLGGRAEGPVGGR